LIFILRELFPCLLDLVRVDRRGAQNPKRRKRRTPKRALARGKVNPGEPSGAVALKTASMQNPQELFYVCFV
jgi:hypothetical protein